MATVSPAVVKNTQNTLGKYVTKPPLTEKLLKKPPFRFLHDIISAVIRQNGILEGLFDEKEMDSENVKDRESKVAYLEKVISCISLATGETISAKPGKIVAGQEPEKTNEFLQSLAKLLDKKIDTSDAVARVLNGEKPGKANAGKKAPTGEKRGKENSVPTKTNARPSARTATNGSTERSKSRDSGQRSRSNSRESAARSRESTATSRTKSSKERRGSQEIQQQESGLDSLPENGGVDSGLGTLLEEETAEVISPQGEEVDEQKRPMTSRPKTGGVRGGRPGTSGGNRREEADNNMVDEGLGQEQETALEMGAASVETPAQPMSSPPQTGASAAAVPRPGSALARPRTGRLKSGRPPSARPAAPRLREKAEIRAEEEMQTRPMTGKVANVIIAGDDKDEDDGDEFLVEEKPKDALDLMTEAPSMQTDTLALATGGQEHGALVQQILETQKELEEVNKRKIGVEIEREGGITDVGRRRDREATQKEVDKLRQSIQTLTRSANPLGKLMDFLQEDVDSMQRELDTWKKENHQLQQELRQEQAMTDESVEPLKVHLAELEAAVQEQLDKISVVKANILRNDEKISRMMSSIGTAAR